MTWPKFLILLFVCAAASFIGSRTVYRPAVGEFPGEFDPVGLGLHGKRVDLNLSGKTLPQFVDALASTYGVPLKLDPRLEKTQGLYRVRGTQMTLAEAIGYARTDDEDENARGLGPFSDGIEPFDYAVVGADLLLVPRDSMAYGAVIRAYDIKPLARLLIPHRTELEKMFPENEGSFGRRDKLEAVTESVSAMLYYDTTEGGIVEDRIPVHSVAGIVFIYARPAQHQRIAKKLNDMMRAAAALEHSK